MERMERIATALEEQAKIAAASVAIAEELLKLQRAVAEPRHCDPILAVIRAERIRQVDAEGWTPEHDDEHQGGELADAAAYYACTDQAGGMSFHRSPWSSSALRKATKSRRRQLIIAAALIVAELERMQRAGEGE